ncbi:MAG: DNA mismatch repair protein MutS, partial [Burkholderiaceae bacterium]
NSLVLIDEIGRGTSTKDGLALAWSIAEELATKNSALSIFSTHYFELTALPNVISTIHNFHFETIEQKDKVIFLYALRKGAASNSFGLKVAKLAGISNDIIERATKIQNRDFTTLQAEANPPATVETLKQKKTSIPHEIRETNLDKITPIQALNLLQSIKKKYGDEK